MCEQFLPPLGVAACVTCRLGTCRHGAGGLFCQFHLEVVLFVNSLGHVVLFAKNSFLYADQ